MKKNADRYLTVTFCDDIRHEVGNKMSLIGCYQGELMVETAPTALPKLCALIAATTPKNKPFKTLTIRVMKDDAELARLEIPEAGLTEVAQNNIDATATRKSISAALMFAPFVIDKPSVLRALATTEEGEMIGPRLLIKVQSMPSTLEPAKPQKRKVVRAKKRPAART
ncbi:MAG: hypothetical protein MOGDAGHF_00897 [Rhodocyclaceae bacterium]|jgi:hypothetical protein|nr:hypothetical protein [Rhodocyclaceae bacterium]